MNVGKRLWTGKNNTVILRAMWKLVGQGTLVLILLVAFVVGGTRLAGTYLTLDDKELFAALIGAGGTIFAGWMAWAAVQRQIANSNRVELQAREAVITEMANALADINYVWEILDVALPKRSDKNKQNSLRSHALSALSILKNSIKPDDLRSTGEALSVLDKLRYREVVRQFERILVEIDLNKDEYGEENESNYWKLLGVRTQFSHLERYLQIFDSKSAVPFKSRKKSNIDHRSQAELLAPLLKEIKDLAQS